jgi:hypothetical protein
MIYEVVALRNRDDSVVLDHLRLGRSAVMESKRALPTPQGWRRLIGLGVMNCKGLLNLVSA